MLLRVSTRLFSFLRPPMIKERACWFNASGDDPLSLINSVSWFVVYIAKALREWGFGRMKAGR